MRFIATRVVSPQLSPVRVRVRVRARVRARVVVVVVTSKRPSRLLMTPMRATSC
jgi:hypothetical protein